MEERGKELNGKFWILTILYYTIFLYKIYNTVYFTDTIFLTEC